HPVVWFLQDRRSKVGGKAQKLLVGFGVVSVFHLSGARTIDGQLAHEFGVVNGDCQGDGSSHAIAEDVRVLDLQLIQQRGGIFSHLLKREGAVEVIGVSVSLQLDRDYLTGLCQRWKNGAPCFNEAERSMKQHERLTRTMDFIVHLEAVNFGIGAIGALLLLSVSDKVSHGSQDDCYD